MKTILLSTFILFTGITFGQSRPHYSFYMLRQNIVNPGAIGVNDVISAAVVGNLQITGFPKSPKTLGVDVIAPIGASGFVIGANLTQDEIGVNKRTYFGGTVAYRLKLATDHYLSIGVNGMGVQYNSDYSSLPVNDNSDPIYTQARFNGMTYDISAGLYYFTNNFYVGIGTMNLTNLSFPSITEKAKTDISVKNMHMVVQMGYQYKMSPDWKLMPSVLFKNIPGSPAQFDVNLQFMYKDIFGFGPSYRTKNTGVFQVNYTIKKMFTIGYSYNMGFGRKNFTNFSGHEVILIFKAKKSKLRLPVDVPRF